MIAEVSDGAFVLYRILMGIATVTFTIILCSVTESYLTSAYFSLYMAIFVIKSDARWAQGGAVLMLVGFMILFAWHGSLASGEFWPLRMASTVAGASSCTNNAYVDAPYNPNGPLDYINSSALRGHWTFCPYHDLRWADATNGAFLGVDHDQVIDTNVGPCTTCTFAGQAASKYDSNLGRGLARGWSVDAVLDDTALCPGVERVVNDRGVIGRGKHVCTHCSQVFVPDTDCDPPDSEWLCYVWCPAYGERQTFQVRFIAEVMLSFAVLVSTYVVAKETSRLTNAWHETRKNRRCCRKKST